MDSSSRTSIPTKLSEGYHYIDVIAYRHRNSGEPEIYSEFKDVIYVDRLKPISAVASFAPIQAGVNQNQRITIKSVDQTANNVHVLWDVGANITDSAIRNMIGSSTQATNIDVDQWTKDLTGATDGNHVATVVTFEDPTATSTCSVSRDSSHQRSSAQDSAI